VAGLDTAAAGGFAPACGKTFLAHAATWAPDGQHIVYAKQSTLYVCNSDGSDSHELITATGTPFAPHFFPMAAGCAHHPAIPTSATFLLWEISRKGRTCTRYCRAEQALARSLVEPGHRMENILCSKSTRDHTQNIWALREATSLLRDLFRKADTEPTQLTVGPLLFSNPTLSPDGKKLFVIGQQRRFDLIQLDGKSNQFSIDLPGVSGGGGRYDAQQRVDRLCVASRPHAVAQQKRTELRVCNSRTRRCSRTCRAGPPTEPRSHSWRHVRESHGRYCDAAEGGTPREVTPEDHNQGDPTWMPKGDAIVLQACRGWITEKLLAPTFISLT